MGIPPLRLLNILSIGIPILFLAGCSGGSQSPGFEYMPDMYRSPAIEAYVDYELNDSLSARKPVEGTIPFSEEHIGKDHNPNFPYPYPDNFDGYNKAGKELNNPLDSTKEILAEGEAIYMDYCSHCHGEKGKGQGALVENGNYPPPPSFKDQLKDLPEGKMFHSLTYGKNLMPAHASQLNKTERWTVIHYLQTLQKDGKSSSEEGDGSTDEEGSNTGGTEGSKKDTTGSGNSGAEKSS